MNSHEGRDRNFSYLYVNSDREKEVLKSISKKFQIVWMLSNYSHRYKEPGIPLQSPECRIVVDGDCSKWMIKLHPGGADATCADFVSAFLYLIDTKHENLIVDCEFVLINSHSKTMGRMEFNSKPFKKGHALGFNELISREILLRDISHDDCLKVICEVKVQYEVETLLFFPPKWSVNVFDKMRADGDFTDITIAVGRSEFQAHKNILAARSPVFFSMFKHEMKEANSGRVEIEDIEPEVFEEFLKYIYSGNAKVEEYSFQLLAVADKYDVQDLKTVCEDTIIKNITKENCFKILVLSDLHSSIKLKEQALNFIATNTRSLSEELIEVFKNQNNS